MTSSDSSSPACRPFLELGRVDKDLQDAEDSLNPMTVDGKFEGEVIFTPACAAQMVYYALSNFISDSVILDKTGLWFGKLGEQVASLYVSNKCEVPRAKNSGFDLVIEAGETSYQDMVKNMKRGLIVGAVSCGQPSANGELSGVAKNSFYVENGEIKGAVMETMINCNLAEMFKNVVSVSKEVLCDGGMVVPYIGVEHVVISGK